MSALLLAAVLSLPAPLATNNMGPEVPVAPSIDKQPLGLIAKNWDVVQLTVSASGSGPFSYQWYHNDAPVQPALGAMGAQTAQLTMLAAAPTATGWYQVKVTSPGGSTMSRRVRVEMVCYPDCNADGLLNLADFGCFTTKFATGDPYADCNGCGINNLADFGCFVTKFALGC